MKRTVPMLLALLGLLVLGFGTTAQAAGPPSQNITQHFHNEQQQFNDVDPCTGQPAQITLVFDGVAHITIQPDGKGHFTETEVGTFAFDYLDQNGNPDGHVDATGRFTEWDGGNGYFDQNGNPIRSVHVSGLEDPTPWLKGGEMLLTVGMGVGTTAARQRAFVGRLTDAGLAGLGFGTGFSFRTVPKALADAAERASFPVFEVP